MEKLEKALDGIKKEVSSKIEEASKTFASNEDVQKLKEELLESVAKAEDLESITESFEELAQKVAGISENQIQENENELLKSLTENSDALRKAFKASKPTESFEIKATVGTISDFGFNNLNPEAPNFIPINYNRTLIIDPQNETSILDHVNVGVATAPVVTWFRMINEEGTAQFVGEGELKPLVDFDVEEENSKAKKIAVAFRFCEEYLDDIPRFESIIRQHLRKLIRNELRVQLINGDGVGANPIGFVSSASAMVSSDFDGTVQNPDNFDVIATLSAYLTCLGCTATTILVNCADYSEMTSEKDADGRLLRPMLKEYAGVNIIEVPGDVIPRGSFLLYDKEEAKVDIWKGFSYRLGQQNTDDFRRNKWMMILEARMLNYVEQPCGFIFDTFANVKTLIARP